MKKNKLLMALVIILLIFTACQNEETSVYDETNAEQLSKEEINFSDKVEESQIYSAVKNNDFVIEGNVVRRGEEEIRLDYHEKYGVVKADEFPMDREGLREPSLDTFLERTGLREQDIANYSIKEDKFSGIGFAQHRMQDGEVIDVPHRFENESVYRFEGEMRDGRRFSHIIIIICSNGLIIIIIW
ncbi:hypothetical protein [Ascidiimonas sp. W6]|uniref:hypothetical protein n=1 Tax=Ascidiimonas meishanensis TaxID=3128903 RepID=UPI0030EEA198